MQHHHVFSRRSFLQKTSLLATATGLGRLGLINAHAQTAPDYKALVCVFMMGGNDGHNMVVPLSGSALTMLNPSGTNYIMGNLGVGRTSPKTKLEVRGTISGSQLLVGSGGIAVDKTALNGPLAAQFTAANSEYLSLADNAAMSTANIDWAFAGWVYFDTVVGGIAEDLVAKYNSSVAAEREYLLFLNSSSPNRLSWSVRDGAGGTETNVTASTFGTVPTAQWLFVVVDHNAATDIISIAVNNGTADTASHTVGGADTIAPFAIGVRSGGSSYMNGRIDETAFWKRILTSDERSYLWNGGLGRTYPLTTP